MPSKKPEPVPVPMELKNCIGIGSLTKPHTFLRPVGSARHRCDDCYARSARIRGLNAVTMSGGEDYGS